MDPGKSPGQGRAAVFLIGSAILGSVALVLWNRKALKSLIEAPESPEQLNANWIDDGVD